jgi:hypothetical protein
MTSSYGFPCATPPLTGDFGGSLGAPHRAALIQIKRHSFLWCSFRPSLHRDDDCASDAMHVAISALLHCTTR